MVPDLTPKVSAEATKVSDGPTDGLVQVESSPSFFKREAGTVQSAKALWGKLLVPVRANARTTAWQSAAQSAGLRYERKVQEHLYNQVKYFISHLPFSFYDNRIPHRQIAIPDGIVFSVDKRLITIIEIKKTHRIDGYLQLSRLYYPVACAAFPGIQIKLLEICQTYDPEVVIRGEHEIVTDLLSWLEDTRTKLFGIYNWTGRT